MNQGEAGVKHERKRPLHMEGPSLDQLLENSELSAFRNPQPGNGPLESRLRRRELISVPGFPEPPLSTLASSLGPDHIDLRGLFSRSCQNCHMVRKNLGKTTHDRNEACVAPDPEAQLADFELAQEGNVIRQDAEFAFFARSYDDIHHFLEERLLRSDNL